LRSAGDCDFFLRAGDGETEFQFGGCADIHVELRGDLRRHAPGDCAGGVVTGRKEIDGEAAFRVGCGGVTNAGSGVEDSDVCAGDAQVVEVDD
jgi:hypothetical protein